MNALCKEVRAVQNPALGAMLLWRCSVGYQEASETAAPMPILLLFVILPILLHKQTADLLSSTQERSGLRKFTEKFQTSAQSKTDLLLALAPRATMMRQLSQDSLQIGLAKSLVALDIESAAVFPLSTTAPVVGVPTSVRPLLLAAEKLGKWLSQVSLYEAGLLLQVPF